MFDTDVSDPKADIECPEGLDAALWRRFLELREQKMHLDVQIRGKAGWCLGILC